MTILAVFRPGKKGQSEKTTKEDAKLVDQMYEDSSTEIRQTRTTTISTSMMNTITTILHAMQDVMKGKKLDILLGREVIWNNKNQDN